MSKRIFKAFTRKPKHVFILLGQRKHFLNKNEKNYTIYSTQIWDFQTNTGLEFVLRTAQDLGMKSVLGRAAMRWFQNKTRDHRT